MKALECEVEIIQHELASCEAVLKRTQASNADHAHSRYRLAQQINELNDHLKNNLELLQTSQEQVNIGAQRGKALEDELSASRLDLAFIHQP